MSGKAAKRGRFFGRRQRKPIEAAERPQDEKKLPNPMRRDDWVRWLELQRELNWRSFKIANGWSIIFKMSVRSQLAGRLALSALEPVVPPLSQVKARPGEPGRAFVFC